MILVVKTYVSALHCDRVQEDGLRGPARLEEQPTALGAHHRQLPRRAQDEEQEQEP